MLQCRCSNAQRNRIDRIDGANSQKNEPGYRPRREGHKVGYTLDFSVVAERTPDLLLAALATIGLALAGMSLALIIGVLGVVARGSRIRILRVTVIAFVEVVRNTPFLVQIFFIFFALPQMGLRFSPTVTAIIALALNGGAYAIEIIRGGVESIHKGQIEAGLALGLHRAEVFRVIVLKPALRAIYPSLTSQFIMLTLTTSVCTSIAAYELTSVAQRIESDTFRSFEVYFTITVMYLLISWMMMGIFALISRYFFNYPVR
jgi:polar amino acid transport system permease protein